MKTNLAAAAVDVVVAADVVAGTAVVVDVVVAADVVAGTAVVVAVVAAAAADLEKKCRQRKKFHLPHQSFLLSSLFL